jgi:tetratricopeptide (TPR) repeat protein
MHYTRPLSIVMLFLAACASAPPPAPTPEPTGQAAVTPPTAAEQEIIQYTTALNLLNVNQLDQAEAEFIGITKHHPDLAGPWANLGLVYIKKNQFDKARLNLDKALEKNPNLAQAYHLLGYIEYKQGNIINAKQFYAKALAKKEDYAQAHYNLALLYDIYLHDIPNAVTHYKRYLELIKIPDKVTADWVTELLNTQKKGPS